MQISLNNCETLRAAREIERDARLLSERQSLPLPPDLRLRAYIATREAAALADSASMRAARVLRSGAL